jgi:hypothetical protein
VFALGCVLGAAHSGDLDWAAPSREAALAEVLARHGLTCDAPDVAWVDPAAGVRGAIFGRSRAIVRASSGADPPDLYLVETRLSPEGAVLWVGDARDVTNTSGADESRPLLNASPSGTLAAYTTSADGLVTGVHVLDLRGPAPEEQADFTRTQRIQAALTNIQQTGQAAGIAHVAFALDPVASRTEISWRDDGALVIQADTHRIVVDPRRPAVLEGADFVRVVPDERARPGNLVTWAVDRVRAMPWFGDDTMQWVKAVAFTVADELRATFSGGTTAEEVRDEIGLPAAANAMAASFTDPDVGWPPAPLKPAYAHPLPGEGQWIALEHDAFITPSLDGSAPAFVTSFLRPDLQRSDVRVYVTLWDPRQVALHMEAGTVEPISATGEHGTGLIPRAPEVMEHVVAAFNGGFQAQHGEYGMRAEGIEYLPPKPYAATVVELRDGSNGFGAWPASANIPDDVIGMRQNLTALVQNGRYNPWGRTWWGGAPPGWPDNVHTARSAICMTQEGFAGYFYSNNISPDDLAQAMLTARCAFGIHLDMNVGHAGFEFYDVAPEGALAPLGRPMQGDWEATGKVPDMPGYVFRARRMIRGMGHMLFPRYIQREARDFFYLTSRSILPGAPVPPDPAQAARDPDEGRWRTKGLPQHGFPYAVATSWARGAGVKLRVVRADPRALKPDASSTAFARQGDPSAASPGEPRGPAILSLLAPAAPSRAARTLWWSRGIFAVDASPPTSGATALLGGCATDAACAASSGAAVGVEDEDGMLVWVELPPGTRPSAAMAVAMDALLARLGCGARMAVPGQANVIFGGDGDEGALDAAGDPRPRGQESASVRFVRGNAPDAHAVFPDTPIVPISVWQPLQAKRIRYFPPKPQASASP